MKYLVALNISTRFFRPAIGEFIHSTKHERHVWRDEETSDIARLAELTNEALDFVRRMDHVDLVVVILPIQESSPDSNTQPPEQEAPTEFALGETPRKKVRKLLI